MIKPSPIAVSPPPPPFTFLRRLPVGLQFSNEDSDREEFQGCWS